MERFSVFFLSLWPWNSVVLSLPLLVVIRRSLHLEDLDLPSEDWVWKWHGCLCNGDPGSTGCTGKPVAASTRDMVLLEFFLSSSSSAPVRIKCGGGIASLDHRDTGSLRCSGKLVTMSSEDMMLSESSSSLCHSKGFPGWSFSIARRSGTQRSTLSGVFLC